ncbi:MAG: hypothetical protein JOZ68_02680 [Acidimicrobiia bacterium]|nr:hypothetical protein [Acidimicrobiia bacterium]
MAAVADPPPVPDAGTLEMRWLKGPGDDPLQVNAVGGYVLQAGEMALRTITNDPPVECLGNPGITGTDPVDAFIAAKCVHLSRAVIDYLRPTKAVVTPAAEPSICTLTLTLDQRTADRIANAAKSLAASLDRNPLGPAKLAGRVLTITGAFMGGCTEAGVGVVNAQVPIPVVGGWGVSS